MIRDIKPPFLDSQLDVPLLKIDKTENEALGTAKTLSVRETEPLNNSASQTFGKQINCASR